MDCNILPCFFMVILWTCRKKKNLEPEKQKVHGKWITVIITRSFVLSDGNWESPQMSLWQIPELELGLCKTKQRNSQILF